MKSKEIKIAIDRGNGTTKVVCSVDGSIVEPFKIPSVIRKVQPNATTTKVGNETYLVGKAAILAKSGDVETPLSNRDKIKDLAVVIAQALHEVLKEGSDISLDIGVASPFGDTAGTLAAVKKEVSRLKDGFTVENQTYAVSSIDRVILGSEGSVILNANPNFNVSIDIGFGTLLAHYRDLDGRIHQASFTDTETGGVNMLLRDLLAHDGFRDAIRKAGCNALPSFEVLSSVISKGNPYELRGVPLMPFVRACSTPLVQRVNKAIEGAYTSFLGLYQYDPEIEFKPVLVGGGSALLQAIQAGSTPVKLSHNAVIFDVQPDYQTALIIHQTLVTSPIELKSTEVKRNVGTSKAVKNSEKQVSGTVASADVDTRAGLAGQTDKDNRESDRGLAEGGQARIPKPVA